MGDIFTFRDTPASTETPVALTEFDGSNAVAVTILPGEDARALIPHLDRIALVAIAFPSFGDGRGYSSARVLREAGYTGEVRATGDVLVDQIRHMRRCGFDSFAPDAPLDPEVTKRALERYDFVYQQAADPAVPVWKLRHG